MKSVCGLVVCWLSLLMMAQSLFQSMRVVLGTIPWHLDNGNSIGMHWRINQTKLMKRKHYPKHYSLSIFCLELILNSNTVSTFNRSLQAKVYFDSVMGISLPPKISKNLHKRRQKQSSLVIPRLPWLNQRTRTIRRRECTSIRQMFLELIVD